MRRFLTLVVAVVVGLAIPAGAAPPTVTSAVLLVSGLEGGSGSTVGPGGDLYVTEGLAGRVSRVDPKTGKVTTFASGLPKSIVGFGGAMDVAFIGHTAYYWSPWSDLTSAAAMLSASTGWMTWIASR